MKKLLMIPMIVLFASCNCKKATTAESDEKFKQKLFEVLAESQYQGKEEEGYEVIKDEASLKSLYKSLNYEDVPRIDFKNQRVVVLFLGQRNSGGYSISIKNVTEKSDKIYVEIEKTQPSGSATMAITNPYYIAKINSTKEVIFR